MWGRDGEGHPMSLGIFDEWAGHSVMKFADLFCVDGDPADGLVVIGRPCSSIVYYCPTLLLDGV